MAIMNAAWSSNPPLLRIDQFKGINLSVTPTQIDQSQSPDMLNMNIDERGALNKRTGYERVYVKSLGPGKMNGLFRFQKPDGTEELLFAHGTKLYRSEGIPTLSTNSTPVELYSGLRNKEVTFFVMNGKCYILNDGLYLVYDGQRVQPVEPYIPIISISKDPAGGGTAYEDFNLLGAGFKDSFSGDGVAVEYQLSLTDLDKTPVTAVVDNVERYENLDFVVDRKMGKVTFVQRPPKGTNNVIITAFKSQNGFADRIKKCRFHTVFGGSNDTRVFLGGNPDMPEYIWRSGLYDPTYFPENGFYKFPDHVRGFAKQYDYLVVERANGKHQVSYSLDNGVASFPSKPINDQVGTVAPKSIQIIENNPVSLSRNGVYMLVSSTIRDERNVRHISTAIDNRLLHEKNLEQAISVDYDKKYWLALNGNVYVYDYSIGEWYVYDNIYASHFEVVNNELYFASSRDGLLYRFKTEEDSRPYNDDGEPIKCHWKSKHFTFGADEMKKLVEKVYYSIKPQSKTSVKLYYVSNRKPSDLVKTSRMDLLDFRNIDFSHWSFNLSTFPQESMAKIKAKKITHFQLIMINDELDEGLGLLSIGIKHRFQSAVK